jgi:alanine dehydrogenase
MAVLYRDSDLADLLTPELAVEALDQVLRMEAEGQTTVPSRLNATAPSGWIRLMPAIIDSNGLASLGFKAMNLNDTGGVRYMMVLYEASSGALVAIMDAARLTRIRTAAVTALACREASPDGVRELGLFGSGHEAEGHATVFKAVFPELARVVVHSPNEERRERFAERMGRELEIAVEPVAEPERAARAPVVVLATKATGVVARSDWFRPGTYVLSIGSTRPDLRELDEHVFARTDVVIADAPDQLALESGDVRAAIDAGHLVDDAFCRLCDLVSGKSEVAWPPDDLLVFKSVGTALQDLAVSEAVHKAALANGRGLELGAFPATNG